MKKILTGIFGLAFLIGSAGIAKADSIFNFEDIPRFTHDPFTETNNGVTATFTTSDPGAFVVDVDPTGIGSGLRLIQTNETAIGSNAHTVALTVSFGGQQFLSAAFPFAMLGTVSDGPQLTLQALLGGTPVGALTIPTTTDQGDNPPYSSGFFSFNPGTAFDSFVLTSASPGFAIDDLSVSTSAVSGVPEPASVALLLFGCAGILAFVRHRRISADHRS
jgi:hypothetical protein